MTRLLEMDTISDLGDTFIQLVDEMIRKYGGRRVIFDKYITGSLQE